MIDELLKKYGLKYEELNPEERETFNSMLAAIQQKALSVEKIKEYITSMKYAVEQELTKYDVASKHDLFLKARLKNYMLLEAFLTSPERAKRALDQALSNINK